MFTAGRPRPARPLFTCIIDLRQASAGAAGQVLLDVPGPLPTLTARLVEDLSADATVQAVLFDGQRPLAVTAKRHAARLPADMRTAVVARDRASRFPGSRQPAGRCQVHHLHDQAHGGDHHVDNVTLAAATSTNDPSTATAGPAAWTPTPAPSPGPAAGAPCAPSHAITPCTPHPTPTRHPTARRPTTPTPPAPTPLPF